MDRERVRFTENAVSYQTTLSFLNSRIKGINSALTGQ
jgi:flagellar basal-body rod protein FlgB